MKARKPTIAQGLRELIRRGEGTSASHPAPEALACYHSGTLPPQEDASVREHLLHCPECVRLILEMEVFADPGEEDAGRSFEPSHQRTTAGARAGAGETRRHADREHRPAASRWLSSRRITRALTSPRAGWTVAAGLMVVLAGGGLFSWWQSRQPIFNVPVVALEPPTRGPAGTGSTILLPPGADRFVLVLIPSETPTSGTLSLDILDSQGERVWTGSGLEPTATGAVTLELPRSILPDGAYRLRLFSGENGSVEAISIRIATR